jgi:hypothetical protein
LGIIQIPSIAILFSPMEYLARTKDPSLTALDLQQAQSILQREPTLSQRPQKRKRSESMKKKTNEVNKPKSTSTDHKEDKDNPVQKEEEIGEQTDIEIDALTGGMRKRKRVSTSTASALAPIKPTNAAPPKTVSLQVASLEFMTRHHRPVIH